MSSLRMMWMLADSTGATTAPAGPLPWWYPFLHSATFPLVLFVVAMWVFVLRAKKPNDKQREKGLKELKRGDRVQTIGGILGTVVDARENDVVLKVDESTNTKIKFSRSAIHRVLEDEKSGVATTTAK